MQDVRVDDQVFSTTIFFLLFATEFARDIPRTVHAAAHGNFEPFAAALPLTALTAVPVHWGMRRSVLCAEDVSLANEADVRSAGERTMMGDMSNLGLLASCRHWPVGTLPRGYFDPVSSDVPILAISGVEDPVLPPHRAEAALRTLPNAVHVVVPGAAHGPNFPACVRDIAARFLEQGSGKSLDTSCVTSMARPPFR
jgi:pimeloyl-ACP methyl ester carboxylesterase